MRLGVLSAPSWERLNSPSMYEFEVEMSIACGELKMPEMWELEVRKLVQFAVKY